MKQFLWVNGYNMTGASKRLKILQFMLSWKKLKLIRLLIVLKSIRLSEIKLIVC